MRTTPDARSLTDAEICALGDVVTPASPAVDGASGPSTDDGMPAGLPEADASGASDADAMDVDVLTETVAGSQPVNPNATAAKDEKDAAEHQSIVPVPGDVEVVPVAGKTPPAEPRVARSDAGSVAAGKAGGSPSSDRVGPSNGEQQGKHVGGDSYMQALMRGQPVFLPDEPAQPGCIVRELHGHRSQARLKATAVKSKAEPGLADASTRPFTSTAVAIYASTQRRLVGAHAPVGGGAGITVGGGAGAVTARGAPAMSDAMRTPVQHCGGRVAQKAVPKHVSQTWWGNKEDRREPTSPSRNLTRVRTGSTTAKVMASGGAIYRPTGSRRVADEEALEVVDVTDGKPALDTPPTGTYAAIVRCSISPANLEFAPRSPLNWSDYGGGCD